MRAPQSRSSRQTKKSREKQAPAEAKSWRQGAKHHGPGPKSGIQVLGSQSDPSAALSQETSSLLRRLSACVSRFKAPAASPVPPRWGHQPSRERSRQAGSRHPPSSLPR